MRVLVCGSRDFDDFGDLCRVLNKVHDKHPIAVVIEGEARGADTLAKKWALAKGIIVEQFPAEWERYGRAAGPIRNKEMLDRGKPDLVIAFPKTTLEASIGTKNMVKQSRKAGIKTLVREK